jgi:hypothetical protein
MRISRTIRTLTVAVALASFSPVVAPAVADTHPRRTDAQPIERAHAHNDYEHDRPLHDALDHGFTSVEADVWLVAGELYIGHDAPDLTRTLANTYLEPLARRFRENGGSIYPHWRRDFRLMIDVKSDGSAAWPAIERELARFPELMTTYRRGRLIPGAVTAVVSGNRDLAAMQAAATRRTFYDGRLGDLTGGIPSTHDDHGQRQLDPPLHLARGRPDARSRARQAAQHRRHRSRERVRRSFLGHPRLAR